MKLEMVTILRLCWMPSVRVPQSSSVLCRYVESARLPDGMVEYIVNAIESLPAVIRASGVQILIFLAGLQSIPRGL